MGFSQYRRLEDESRASAATHHGYITSANRLVNTRKPRSAGIFQAIRQLDTEIDQATRRELGEWIRKEYEGETGDIPLGFIAECFLGPPFVDHRLDLVHSIVQHFAPADIVPEPFAQARMLVRNGAYAFVEVYASGRLIPVFADGVVVA